MVKECVVNLHMVCVVCKSSTAFVVFLNGTTTRTLESQDSPTIDRQNNFFNDQVSKCGGGVGGGLVNESK